MKAKVIIEDGITEIVLIPVNEFEKKVIEVAKDSYDESTFQVDFRTEKPYGVLKDHEIRIRLTIKT